MLNDKFTLDFEFEIQSSTDEKYQFVSIGLKVDNTLISNPDEISLLGLIEGEVSNLLNNMSLLRSSHQNISPIKINQMDFDYLFNHLSKFILDEKAIEDLDGKYTPLMSRAILAFPFANECFDGVLGFLFFFSDDESVIFWKDFSKNEIQLETISFSAYYEIWGNFLMEIKNQKIK